jgi:hypothetical protein
VIVLRVSDQQPAAVLDVLDRLVAAIAAGELVGMPTHAPIAR